MTGLFSKLLDTSGQSVSNMIEKITYICRNLKKRTPGSKGERKTAEYLAAVLKEECGCDRVKLESFREHPDSFYGYFFLSAVCDVLCALCYFITPWLSILFGGTALFLFVVQFILYKELIDPLFPEKTGTNVTALRPCRGEVKRRVFFNGHIDAAWEFPLNHYFGGVVFEIPGVMALLGVLFYIVISICTLLGASVWTETAAKTGLIFVPFCALIAFTCNPWRTVDGANDNLTGCMMGVSLLREMERHGICLDNTEVGVILTGSDEAGLRGAKAWAKEHREEYQDVPSFIFSYDTIHDPRYLMVNERDLNGTVKSDMILSKAFLQAAENAGVPCRRGWVPPFGGATDSTAFTQGGFRSVGITGLNHKLEDYYHTRRDTYDNLDSTGLKNCYRASVELLNMIDQGCLDS